MTGRRRRAAALAVSFSVVGSSLVAQATGASLDLGASIVEYDGFLVSGAAVLSPTLRFDTRAFTLGAQGSWTIFESGNQVVQGNLAAAWLAPAAGPLRVELSGALGGSQYADQPSTGHALGRARFHLLGERAGGWVSATTGGTFAGSTLTPVEVSVGGWAVRDRVAGAGAMTGTWTGRDGYMDVVGAVRWTVSRLELQARAVVRPWTSAASAAGEPRTGVSGDVSALLALNHRLSLELSGGSYPNDPIRRVLAAKYVTMGLRVNLASGPREVVPELSAVLLRAARDRVAAHPAGVARLEVAPAGQPRVVRVYVDGATSVELMGDITDWQAVPLIERRNGVWEARLPVAPGVHRVNLRIDGRAWIVPAGTRLERDDFGGEVGVVVVP